MERQRFFYEKKPLAAGGVREFLIITWVKKNLNQIIIDLLPDGFFYEKYILKFIPSGFYR